MTRRDMNSDVFINRLLERRVITRERRGWYKVHGIDYREFNREHIHEMFGYEVEPGRYVFNDERVRHHTPEDAVVHRPTRRINRHRYDSQPRNVRAALERLQPEEDGVKRSYGIEYEINYLTTEEESELAYLLDTLPPHATESDGSLTDRGVEIIFEPVGRKDAVNIVNTLAEFVRRHDVDMNNAGMHITFGVDNSTVGYDDLVIRTNRLALAVKAVGLQGNIRELFGRDFTSYARLPNNLNTTERYRAFNVRRNSCWENRLVQWDCNIEKLMKFFDIAEVLFHRPFEAQDFIKVFELLGADTSGV